MRMPQIRIQSHMAQISISQTSGGLGIKQGNSTLSMEQPEVTMNYRTKPGTLTIDQTQAWEEMNLYSTLRVTEKASAAGMAEVKEGTQRRASQGDQLMKIENDGNPIINQAIVNGSSPEKTIGLKYIPSPFSVKIDYQPSELSIDANERRLAIHAQKNKPEINYERANVIIGMKQYGSLNIDFINVFSKTV